MARRSAFLALSPRFERKLGIWGGFLLLPK